MRLPRALTEHFALIAGLAVLAVIAGSIGWERIQAAEQAKTSYNRIDSIRDVHGLGLQADDPHKLYIATHDGLIRAFHDRDWSRVGAVKADIKGLAAHPIEPLTFFASGHDGRTNLGLRKTIDGGFTWQTVGLDGKDLHTIAVSRADPTHMWAYDGKDLHTSIDGASSWQPALSQTPEILNLVSDPNRAATVYAATPQGIQQSDDAGSTWRVLSDIVATSLAVHPTANGTLYAGTARSLMVSRDYGGTWEDLELVTRAAITQLVIDPETPTTLYAATANGELHKTETSGATWERLAVE